MEADIEKWIKENKERLGLKYNKLEFLNGKFSFSGPRVKVDLIKAMAVNNVDIYDLPANNIVSNDGSVFVFNKDFPYKNEKIYEAEYLGENQLKVNGEIYTLLNSDFYYFSGDFEADPSQAENAMIECMAKYLNTKIGETLD